MIVTSPFASAGCLVDRRAPLSTPAEFWNVADSHDVEAKILDEHRTEGSMKREAAHDSRAPLAIGNDFGRSFRSDTRPPSSDHHGQDVASTRRHSADSARSGWRRK